MIRKRQYNQELGQKGPSLPRPRSVEKNQARIAKASAVPRQVARSFRAIPQKINPLIILVALLSFVLLGSSLAQPLRNYFDQRSELAATYANIQVQRAEKQRLEEQLKRYEDEDYVREQARMRLGAIEPGEAAYRLMDPLIPQQNLGTDKAEAENDSVTPSVPWYTQLWDSVVLLPQLPEAVEENNPQPGLHVPTVDQPVAVPASEHNSTAAPQPAQ